MGKIRIVKTKAKIRKSQTTAPALKQKTSKSRCPRCGAQLNA